MRKYKVGDKIRIKTWKQMEKEFRLNNHGNIKREPAIPENNHTNIKNYDPKINYRIFFQEGMEQEIDSLNRLLTISKITEYSGIKEFEFFTEETDYYIGRAWIEEINCHDNNEIEIGPVESRFELLDL